MGTSILAEATTVLKALTYYKLQGFGNVMIETDSLGLKKILTKEWRIPRENVHIVEEIQSLMELINNQLHHIYKEDNYLADVAANPAITGGMQQFGSFDKLPSMARKILNIDKQQIPLLRISTKIRQQQKKGIFTVPATRKHMIHIKKLKSHLQ